MAGNTPYLIYGLNTVLSMIEHAPERVLSLSVEKSRHDERMRGMVHAAELAGLKSQNITAAQLHKQLGDVNHQGVMALVRPPQARHENELLERLAGAQRPPLLLCLDGVQDPHNLGACLRSADAAGVDAVIAPRDRACGLTATVSKVASGAAETLPFYAVTNLARCLRELQALGIWCLGLAGESDTEFYTQRLDGPIALVLGAEGSGLRRLTRETCDELVSLPMRGSVSSLNVSVTAGICLYEALRQRGWGAS